MFADLLPGKHLLFDNTSIADTYRLTRVMHQPVRDPVTPVLVPEEDWEGQSVTPLHVTYDEARKRYRMWYQAHDQRVEEERKALKTSRYGNVGAPQPIYLCYAESTDGVKWDRPALGIFKHTDGRDTNIVFKGHSYSAGNTIIEKPGGTGDERFILVNCDWYSEQVGGIYFAHSGDGIHWNYYPTPDNQSLIHGESDTWNSVAWNPKREVYMLYMRAWHASAWGWNEKSVPGPHNVGPWKGNPRRRVSYSESRDLKNWSEPQIIYGPDELDTNDFYGVQVFRYEDYFLAWLWLYDDDQWETIDVELAWSHDGIHWQRHPRRPKLLPARPTADRPEYMMIPAQQPTIVGDDVYLYHVAHNHPHSREKADTKSYRTRLRRDGFVSLEAGRQPGTLVTRPFVIQNDHISINARADRGEIIAELVEPWWYDPSGKAIEGFAAKDFDVIREDNVTHRLSWRGKSDLSALKGKRVLLRIALYHAGIYSITS